MSLKRLLISIAAASLLALGARGLWRRATPRRSPCRRPAARPRTGERHDGQEGEHHRQRSADRPRLARRDLQERQGGRRAVHDVEFELLQAADADSQAQQIEQAIAKKPDALVVLPQDGAALTPVAQKAERAGIPVVNIDRLFTGPDAATATILGDNYQIGVLAADYIAEPAEVQGQRRRDPGPGRHLGHDGPDARASPTSSRRSARTAASRSSPGSPVTSTRTPG